MAPRFLRRVGAAPRRAPSRRHAATPCPWLLAGAAAFAGPATAQPATPPGPQTVVVTAARSPQPLADVLADVSVVERAEIDASGAVDVAELLARLPGVEFVRNGGPGGATGVFVRGAESRHVAVFVDGVRVDAQAVGGATWEAIALDRIERIEVLRGPAAAVYGSDAVGGVVQLFTRGAVPGGAAQTAVEGLRPEASLRAGSHATVQTTAGLAGRLGAARLALGAAAGRSRGFDSQPGSGSPDADGWRRSSVSASVGVEPAAGHRVDASVSSSRLDARFDGFVAGADDVTKHALDTAAVAWQGRWSDAATTRAQLGGSRSALRTVPDAYRTVTRIESALVQHEQRVAPGQLVSVALERRVDRLANDATAYSDALVGRRTQDALALGWRGGAEAAATDAAWPHVAWQLHARHDRDSEFGGQTTGSAAVGVGVARGWRLHASAATSFRAPTLYQRFSEYGVASLRPEHGRNVEVGLRWHGARAEAGLVAWRHRVADLIGFGAAGPCASSFGCYGNTGRARLDGATLSGRATVVAAPGVRLALRGSLDWHDPRDEASGEVLSRRARRLAFVGADATVAGWRLGAEVQAVGRRVDRATFPDPTPLGGYALVNVAAGRDVAPGVALELRVDNAGDRPHAQAAGYATAGRTAQLALRWTPR